MRLIKTADIDINELRGLAYRIDCRKEVLVNIMSKGIVVGKELFDTYNKEYEDSYSEYQDAKANLLQHMVGNMAFTTSNFSWNLDFASGLLTVTTNNKNMIDSLLKEGFHED